MHLFEGLHIYLFTELTSDNKTFGTEEIIIGKGLYNNIPFQPFIIL